MASLPWRECKGLGSPSLPRFPSLTLLLHTHTHRHSPSLAAPPFIAPLPPCSELESQGDQIARTQRKLDETEANVDKSNFILKGMGSIWGALSNKFSKKPATPKEAVVAKDAERAAAAAAGGGASPAAGAAGGKGGAGSQQKGGQQQQQSASSKSSSAPLSEDELLLQQISASMGSVKNIALAMGSELEKQDKMLDGLSSSIDRVDGKLGKATSTATKLAK